MTDASRHAAALRALAALDLTDLSDAATEAGLDSLCARAATPYGAVAAVCVWPRFVARARERLAGTKVRIATVANFPAGGEDAAATGAEIAQSVADGADEIDVVLPWRAMRAGREGDARRLVDAARAATGARRLKVILETGELAEPDLIARAARLAIDAGADFIKTSTGKTPVSATPQAAETMLRVIADSGRPVGFKASGGVRTLDDARIYLSLADRIMGPDWAAPARFRIGASGLLDALVAELRGARA
ncbi:MAG: deoxyribose-phosphate aldolase [Rhizobiales bacterium]|nr:deoxyribose-phosphate aldolase [Hyphomicrobiales bacterium]